ncbi:MAG: hypothetical protein ACOY0T_39295 [Myxococcota bacterium]
MMRTRRALSFALLAAACSLAGCAVGEGEGSVKSDRLYLKDCWNGPFDLRPDFFAANPYQDHSLMIRIQRGDNIEEQSDGLLVVVNQLQSVRQKVKDGGGEATLKVGLPPGVSPPGVPLVANPDPPVVSLALYLHKSCHAQNATIYSTAGSITFRSLFSGDPQEADAEEKLTDATFDATFADPRQLQGAIDPPDPNTDVKSQVTGNFRFYFQRGQPAQPFQ